MIDITSYTGRCLGARRSNRNSMCIRSERQNRITTAKERFERKPATTNSHRLILNTIKYYRYEWELAAVKVDYSKTDSFELLYKTITCNKFLQIKSVYVITFVAILLTSSGPCTVHVLATQKYRHPESSDPPKVAIGKGC